MSRMQTDDDVVSLTITGADCQRLIYTPATVTAAAKAASAASAAAAANGTSGPAGTPPRINGGGAADRLYGRGISVSNRAAGAVIVTNTTNRPVLDPAGNHDMYVCMYVCMY
jgi:hypothetical protein